MLFLKRTIDVGHRCYKGRTKGCRESDPSRTGCEELTHKASSLGSHQLEWGRIFSCEQLALARSELVSLPWIHLSSPEAWGARLLFRGASRDVGTWSKAKTSRPISWPEFLLSCGDSSDFLLRLGCSLHTALILLAFNLAGWLSNTTAATISAMGAEDPGHYLMFLRVSGELPPVIVAAVGKGESYLPPFCLAGFRCLHFNRCFV